MTEQSNILDTVKTKLIQASSDTVNNDGRETIRKVVVKLLEQFDNIASQTNYNGRTLLQKSENDTSNANILSFQMGEYEGFDAELKASRASNTNSLGGGDDRVFSGSVGDIVNNGFTSTSTNNNILVGSSKQINLTGSIELQVVDISSSGTETNSTSVALDIDVSGKIGSIKATNSDVILDISSQSNNIKDAIKAIANNNSNFNYSSSTDRYKLTAGNSIDFGDLNFSDINIKQVAGTGTLSLNTNSNKETNLVISDNNININNPLLGQINMLMENDSATGGKTLSDIKDLKEYQLTQDKANQFMETVDKALTQLNSNRADFGSIQKQLESSMRSMKSTHTNLKVAESIIRDLDYSSESTYFNKQNIIAQAGSYVMSQANSMTQTVVKLLQ